jgi:putative SOS response-associated peptidase YedK
MCGRYALTHPPDVLAAIFRLAESPAQLQLRYNIAPTQHVPVVVQTSHGRELQQMRWGLIPCWARDASIGNKMINARSESVGEKRVFRTALQRRRCIVPASGFFEWKKMGKTKQPYYIHRADGQPLGLAGLWETWRNADQGGGEQVRSFTILTTDASEAVRDLHDRMPVILEPEAFDRWLDPKIDDAASLQELLVAPPEGVLAMHPVSTRVNSPANDAPSVLEQCEPESRQQPRPESGGKQPSLFGDS